MPKKSKQKKNVKQIPAKAGAKAKVGSGGKVEVVLKTTKVVKDASRGKYKPRKKTNKKQDATKQQKDALSVLREQIELEKLQALQRQQAQAFQPSQRLPNRRTTGDINQFFRESKNTGKTEVISDLTKEIKELKEEVKKKNVAEPSSQEPQEDKSKFKSELEEKQNQIQQQRIRSGIEKQEERNRRLMNQKRIDEFERKEKQERLRRERGIEAREKERTARQQSKVVSDERFREQESLKRARELELQDIEKQKEERRSRAEERGKIALKNERQRRKEEAERLAKEEKQQKELQEAIQKENQRRLQESREYSSRQNVQKIPEPTRAIIRSRDTTKSAPTPEPEPVPVQTKRTPKPKEKTISEVSQEIINTLDNQPLLVQERNRARAEEEDDTGFNTAEEDEPLSPATIRRQQFLERTKSPAEEKAIQEQLKKDKLREEAEKLRQLQESGDKAFADRLQAQLQIEDDERKARDLMLREARKRDFQLQSKEIDDAMRKIKDKKKAEKKKARDNLRKREQEEFLDETAGEIIREAVEQNVGERTQQREKASRELVGNVFKNVVGGRALANEIATATQNIPRTQTGRYSDKKIEEKVGDLIHSDRTKKVERKAYSLEDAKNIQDLRRYITNLKEKIALVFPKYFKQNMFKSKQSLQKSQSIIKSIIEQAKSDGELTGLQLVKLETLLNNLAESINEVVLIENRYRGDRELTEEQRETAEERRQRIRREQAGLVQQEQREPQDDDY